MKAQAKQKPIQDVQTLPENALTTELLILPDGQILVHNLTGPFAGLLAELNPNCEPIASRITPPIAPAHELPS